MSKSFRFVLFCAGIMMFASCKNFQAKEEYFTVNPNPLEAEGGQVTYTVTGTFPKKTFIKKVVCVATPELRWEGGSVKGEPVTLQGEKIQANNQVIAWKEGGSFTYNGSFKYQPEMAKSELWVTFEATKKGKPIEVEPVHIADGVLATAELYSETAKGANTAGSKDAFQRIIDKNQEANIMFVIQQANVRSSETNSDAVKALKESLKNFAADTKNYAINNVTVSAYASPDGGVKLNDKLASQRESNAVKYVKNEVKKAKADAAIESEYTAQDWKGFESLVSQSNLQDKDLLNLRKNRKATQLYDNYVASNNDCSHLMRVLFNDSICFAVLNLRCYTVICSGAFSHIQNRRCDSDRIRRNAHARYWLIIGWLCRLFPQDG